MTKPNNNELVEKVALALATHAQETEAKMFGRTIDTATFKSQCQSIAYMYTGAAEAVLSCINTEAKPEQVELLKKYPDNIPEKDNDGENRCILIHSVKGILHDQWQYDGEEEKWMLRSHEFFLNEGITHWCYESDFIALSAPINPTKG